MFYEQGISYIKNKSCKLLQIQKTHPFQFSKGSHFVGCLCDFYCVINGSVMIKLYDKTCLSHHMVREHHPSGQFFSFIQNVLMMSHEDGAFLSTVTQSPFIIEVLRIKLPSKHNLTCHPARYIDFFIYEIRYNQHLKSFQKERS